MPRFYFDFHDEDGAGSDDVGEELPNAEHARRRALEALGDACRDFSRRHQDGRLTIRVRDHRKQVLQVSATFETKLP